MAFDPRFLTWPHWIELTGSALKPYGYTPRKVEEKDWRQWAEAAFALPALAEKGIPSPYGYAGWRDWAYKLNEALLLLGIV